MSAFLIKVVGQIPYYGIFAKGADAWTAAQRHFPDSIPTSVIDLTRFKERQQAK